MERRSISVCPFSNIRILQSTYILVMSFMILISSSVLCANKALLDASPSLSDQLRPIISPSTSIVLLQNGVGAEDPLHASFPENTIISAVVWTGGRTAETSKDGKPGAENFNREGLTIGVDYKKNSDKAKEDERLKKVVALLEKGGSKCTVVDDIQSERWVKVIW